MENVITTLVWAALIQGIILAGLYLFSKKHRSLANRLLGLFLLVIVYEGILAFLPYDRIGGYSFYYFAFPEVKLFYPVLFFHYILEKVGRSGHYRKVLKVHYILAFAVAGITVVNVSLYLFTGKKIEDYLGVEKTEWIFMAQQYYAFLLIIAIFIASIIEVKRYKQIVQLEYSDYSMLEINWLWRLIFVILPIIILWGVNLVWIIMGGKNSFDFEMATWGAVVIFLYFVSFQAYQHKNLFEEVGEGAAPAQEEMTGLKKNRDQQQAGLTPEEEEQVRRIRRYMEKHEPYLDPSLSMYQLSRQLNIPDRDLSALINHKLNQHFFDFVNEYRIKKAMEILRDPENDRMTVLEILYEVGFNSKSSFNTVFKKYCGQTPTQYRKNHSTAGG